MKREKFGRDRIEYYAAIAFLHERNAIIVAVICSVYVILN